MWLREQVSKEWERGGGWRTADAKNKAKGRRTGRQAPEKTAGGRPGQTRSGQARDHISADTHTHTYTHNEGEQWLGTLTTQQPQWTPNQRMKEEGAFKVLAGFAYPPGGHVHIKLSAVSRPFYCLWFFLEGVTDHHATLFRQQKIQLLGTEQIALKHCRIYFIEFPGKQM